MPALWKKQQKGSRISKLVSDIQTTPDNGASLLLQTGFPTSLVDLFHKNRDKLHKASKKKHRSNKPNLTSQDRAVQPSLISQLVSYPRVSLSNSQLPISSADDDKENPTNVSNYMLIEEDVEKLNIDPRKDEYKGVIYPKIVGWLCVLMGVFIVGVALCNKRFVWGITLGALLLVLLECVGNKVFRVFKCCEGGVLLSILKGVLIAVVALYCKRFVVGITMGAIALFLVEYGGKKLVFRFLKLCDDVKDQLRGCDRVVEKRDVEEKLGRGLGRGNGKGVLMEGVDSEWNIVVEKDGENGAIKSEVQQEVANWAVVTREIELEVEHNRALKEQEKGSSLKGKTGIIDDDFAVLSGNHRRADEEKQIPVCENAIEQNYSVWPRQPDGCGSDEYCEMPEKKGEVQKCKGKKFWKKLHMGKRKKNKHGKRNHEADKDCL